MTPPNVFRRKPKKQHDCRQKLRPEIMTGAGLAMMKEMEIALPNAHSLLQRAMELYLMTMHHSSQSSEKKLWWAIVTAIGRERLAGSLT